MTNTEFYAYLTRIRPYINAEAIGRASGLPKNALGKHYHWVDTNGKPGTKRMPLKHAPAIIGAIESLQYNPETP